MKYTPFHLHLTFKDGSEQLLRQNNFTGVLFEFYKKPLGSYWDRVYKKSPYIDHEQYGAWLYGTPITLGEEYGVSYGGLTGGITTVRTGTRPQPLGLASAAALRLDQERASHRVHLEEHARLQTEYHSQYLAARQEMTAIQTERERREAQSLADRRQAEEERNRPRQPWERVRDMFR